IQYKDYVYWHNLKLQGEGLNKERVYWHKKLAGPILPISLPYDYPRPVARSYAGAKHGIVLTRSDSDAVRRLCQQNEVSLYIFLVAVVKVLLYNYSGQKDILIGSPISGRDHVDIEEQIGLFLNNLVIRSEINNQDRFREALDKEKAVILEAYQH